MNQYELLQVEEDIPLYQKSIKAKRYCETDPVPQEDEEWKDLQTLCADWMENKGTVDYYMKNPDAYVNDIITKEYVRLLIPGYEELTLYQRDWWKYLMHHPLAWAFFVGARGCAKSFTSGLQAIGCSDLFPGTATGVFAGSFGQAQKPYNYIKQFLESPNLKYKLSADPTLELTSLKNGSKVIVSAASETAVRGIRLNIAIHDEICQQTENLYEIASFCLQGTPGHFHQKIILGTPDDPQHFSYKMISDDLRRKPKDREFFYMHVPARPKIKGGYWVPHISDAEIQKDKDRVAKGLLSLGKYIVSIDAEWYQTNNPVFDPIYVNACTIEAPPKPFKCKGAVLGIDWGWNHFSSGVWLICDGEKVHIVHCDWIRGDNFQEFINTLEKSYLHLKKLYDFEELFISSEIHGVSRAQNILLRKVMEKYKDVVVGSDSFSHAKDDHVKNLADLLINGRIIFYCPKDSDENSVYRVTNQIRGAKRKTDDNSGISPGSLEKANSDFLDALMLGCFKIWRYNER